jgi:hypothetical protein
MRRLVLALFLVTFAAPFGARAEGVSSCAAGGPGPGYRILKLDLPNGSEFLTMQIKASRQTRPNDGPNAWHQSIGVFVLNANGMKMQAYKLQNIGMAPRHAVVDNGDTRQEADTVGPDVPIVHTHQDPASSLAPGTYYIIIASSDGGAPLPNDYWFASVQFSGTGVHCDQIGHGDLIDIDQSEFTGGTQTYVPIAGAASGISDTYSTARAYTVLFTIAETGGIGDASLDYALPGAVTGTAHNEMKAFVLPGGTSTFTASYSGLYPLIAVEGLSFDLT